MNTFEIRNEMMSELFPPFRLLQVLQRSSGFSMDWHSHDFYHLNFVTSGTLYVQFKDKKHILNEGQAIILPPHEPHALQSPNGYSQIGIDISNTPDERGIHQLFIEAFPQGFAQVNMLKLPCSFNELCKAIRNVTKFNTFKLLNTAESLLLAIIEESRLDHNQSFHDKFLDMLSQEGGMLLSLEQMCQKMQISKTQLERMTQQEFHCGAVEYKNKLKTMKACLFLQNTNLSIKIIVEKLGFCDESHFNRFFKKRMGLPPFTYRNQYRKLIN